MVKKVFDAILIFCMIVSLFLFILLTSLQHVAFDINFYKAEFDKNKIAVITGMDMDDLLKVITTMQNYLKGKEKTLDIEMKISGSYQRMFNDKELAHMEDVKNLFHIGFLVKDFSMVIFILLFIYFLLTKSLYKVSDYILRGLIGIYVFLGLFALAMLIDFDKWFTDFHLMFFDNDLWQLDVAKDRLIQMFPLEFFQDAVFLTLRNATLSILAISFIAYIIKNSKKTSLNRTFCYTHNLFSSSNSDSNSSFVMISFAKSLSAMRVILCLFSMSIFFADT
ncbi:integral membrane protein TIGR01906 [Thermoanaerobacter kivui]|uniref:Integral membrane protein TIGR01906 n=1 Tax=Thermoanaerobacter kivui TaxID=2325 RepID=A0A097AT38_THEKI|nr:integral membrane protein TIGR01906 [Thermoanaerobacter kivui]